MTEIKVLDKGFVRLVDHMGDDNTIARSARVSYAKGTKSVQDDKNLIRYLWRNKHTSPFEMVTFTFHVKLPIFVSNQWVRHRTWSFNQISGRYSEMPDEFYVPQEEHCTFQNPNNKQGGTNDQITTLNIKNPNDWWDCFTPEEMADSWSWGEIFENEQKTIRNQYEKLLGTGMRRELARINLPLSQYTEMYASVDLHNLLHFLRLRLDHHAQYEIRVYAEALLELIKPIVPVTVESFNEYTLHSMQLHKKDIEGLKIILHNSLKGDSFSSEKIETLTKSLFENKREFSEFISKINKLVLG